MGWLLISWPILILLGLGLRMSLRITYGIRGADYGDPLYELLNILGWVLIVLGLTPAVLGGLFTIAGGIVVVLAAATLIEVVTQRRAAQRRSLCALLAAIVARKQRLDASALLDNQLMRGTVGRKARRLFQELDAGMPLASAIRRNPRALPAEAIAYVAAGRNKNAESAALRELSRTDQSALASIWRASIDRLFYLACVVTVMIVVLTFVMIKIVPAYRQIFDEFMVSLPPMTELAVYVSNVFVRYLATIVILGLVVMVIAAVAVAICLLCDVPVLQPITDRLFRGRRLADVLHILAVATEQRQPLPDVLDRIALVYPSPTINRQLVRAAESMHHGAEWQDALFQARILRAPEVPLLKTAERTGDLPWTLRQIALRRSKRSVYRLASALQVIYPALILLLGSTVAFFVISLFVPIISLISGLSR